MKNRGLGKGLNALLEEANKEYSSSLDENISESDISSLSIDRIIRNESQPRRTFDEESLKELSESIKIHGIISPIVVTPRNGQFLIVTGERRYRAAQMAGLTTVPVIIREYSNQQIREIALIENLQREDLNPIDAAFGIKELMNEFGFTQESVATRIGKSRPAIANTLRLLTLSDEVQKLVIAGKLSAGHARTLVILSTAKDQLRLAQLAVDKQLSVRALEKLVKDFTNPAPKMKVEEKSIELRGLEKELEKYFKTKVSIHGNDKKGKIVVEYFSRDDLDRINDLIK